MERLIAFLFAISLTGCLDLAPLPIRPDAATDTAPSMTDCGADNKYDRETGLCWEDPPGASGGWASAIDRCEELESAGYTNWRLPTIDELKSLLRGCSSSECQVSDPDCVNAECVEVPECEECASNKGPGEDGCYWSADLSGQCDYDLYWSSSQDKRYETLAWALGFDDGEFDLKMTSRSHKVRCVRSSGSGDADADSDVDTDTDTDTTWCEGWYDKTSRLCWEDPLTQTPDAGLYDRLGADDHCDGLGGLDWRVPSISELRSLVRDCPASEWDLLSGTGGACHISDDCTSNSCFGPSCSSPCDVAPECHWDPQLSGLCPLDSRYWSSTENDDSTDQVWTVKFYDGSIFTISKVTVAFVRCAASKP